MNNLLIEINKVKSELTLEEINSALECLMNEKENAYLNDVKRKKEKIDANEKELSSITIKIKGRGEGLIKIVEIGAHNGFPVGHISYYLRSYFADKHGFCHVTNYPFPCICFNDNKLVYPFIKYIDMSIRTLSTGDIFSICDEEFVVLDKGRAIAKNPLQGCGWPMGRKKIMWESELWLDQLKKKAYEEKIKERNK